MTQPELEEDEDDMVIERFYNLYMAILRANVPMNCTSSARILWHLKILNNLKEIYIPRIIDKIDNMIEEALENNDIVEDQND
jgi:hypothetical protein